jgi:hypothetical protein
MWFFAGAVFFCLFVCSRFVDEDGEKIAFDENTFGKNRCCCLVDVLGCIKSLNDGPVVRVAAMRTNTLTVLHIDTAKCEMKWDLSTN